jgi:hypothetical protein
MKFRWTLEFLPLNSKDQGKGDLKNREIILTEENLYTYSLTLCQYHRPAKT